jgi:hypothetical protein
MVMTMVNRAGPTGTSGPPDKKIVTRGDVDFVRGAPLPADRIAVLYASPDAYLDAYTNAADATIAAGFLLQEDREALLADAHPSRVMP